MTTSFRTKQEALERGIFYAGRAKNLKVEQLRKVKGDLISIAGLEEGAEFYEFENLGGITVRIAIAPFRGLFCLWLITPCGAAYCV